MASEHYLISHILSELKYGKTLLLCEKDGAAVI